ncbi:hypothetical protein D915_007935 [Fasciola hepatica]|uniref:Uncharacterized protein n=1 Tax=Fasciola hepatica TaxID=6192 RepID=A0A4E0R494_FASHE|nr:hypothetical protein D915_007935 [Fasciola hepatica]
MTEPVNKTGDQPRPKNAFVDTATDVGTTEDVHNNEAEMEVELIRPSQLNVKHEAESESIQVEYGDQSERYDFPRTNDENYIKDMDPGLFRKILMCAAAAGRSGSEGSHNAKTVTGGLTEAVPNQNSDVQPTENAG